ncbi:dienelactone hydrolase family protein [Paraliomyxa miuraensis]|uniref:dienelactone hydrolase family protein n=1 Tax=Paraliomyxa miuraensis TaxID=376150 RepID=UPI0022518866|nr:dienelactone hydrolase family protein [Paraliomyxa miuraensis]MCX4241894.1 dienelactone hydrolase family protein [Paraliomyxa miuraensis]
MHGYARRTFDAPVRDGTRVTHDVYERGDGPPVVLVQELPGIGPQTLRLADRLVDAGYRVVLPHLFGPLGRVSMVGNVVRALCMRRELRMFARNESSAVVDWLRALCQDVRERQGVAGVGVIGMCLTGNFAITLMADDSVLAAVASQPSLPAPPRQGLHMSPAEVAAARDGLTAKGPMLAFRFAGDLICSAKKFEGLGAAFNDDQERIRLVTLPGRGHSVLTRHFVDEQGHPTQRALRSVLEYFGQRLGGARPRS